MFDLRGHGLEICFESCAPLPCHELQRSSNSNEHAQILGRLSAFRAIADDEQARI